MLQTAFTLLGTPVTWLELIAFALALANITCNVFEIHWGWPLTLVASALYAWLFLSFGLYGEMGVNLFFAVTALWGWWQWLRGSRPSGSHALQGHTAASALRIERLSRPLIVGSLAAWALLWLVFGTLLDGVTDSTVPWVDGFVTAGSVVGTVLLGRKYLENWVIWMVVNAVSVGLFAYKGLTLTALLYVIFLVLAFWGWSGWLASLFRQTVAGSSVIATPPSTALPESGSRN